MFRHLEHTADLALAVEAASLEELFADSLRGFTDCVTALERVRPQRRYRLAAVAPALDQLLVAWLEEALFAFEVRGEVFRQARARVRRTGEGWSVRGEARGEPWDPERHPFKVAIKAVTYHRLCLEQRGSRWLARVVFDI